MSGGKKITCGRALALAVAALALLLSGCARVNSTPEAVTITFACLDEEIGYYQGLADAFKESHGNITIKLLPKRLAAFQALGPAEADAFYAPQSLELRIERGEVLSLDAWLTADGALKNDFFPGVLATYTRDGKVYALPSGLDPMLMYYNKDLFDTREVPYPKLDWTWDQFLDTGKQVRDPLNGVYGYAAGMSLEEPLLFVLQHGGRVAEDWQNPTRLTFNDTRNVEALQWYAQMVFEDDVSPNQLEARAAFGDGRFPVYNGVLAGRVGMWVGLYSSRGGQAWTSKTKFNWGVTALPRDRQAATLAGAEALAISAQTRHPEECWQWLTFLSEQPPRRLAPARRSVAGSAAYARLVGPELANAVRVALEHAVVLPGDPPSLHGKLGEIWAKVVDDLISGRYAVEETLTRAQQLASK